MVKKKKERGGETKGGAWQERGLNRTLSNYTGFTQFSL